MGLEARLARLEGQTDGECRACRGVVIIHCVTGEEEPNPHPPCGRPPRQVIRGCREGHQHPGSVSIFDE